jgi:hypothetical protein
MWSAVVGLACWAQPLGEQLTGANGNLGRLLTNAGSAEDTLGLSDAATVVSAVLVEPPWWGRPSFRDTLGPAAVLPGSGTATVELLALAAVLVAVWAWARRRRDTAVAVGAETVAVALVIGIVAAATLPLGVFGLAAHQFRWLWPLGAVLLTVLVLALSRAARTVAALGAFAVLVAAAVAALPHWNPELGPAAENDGARAAHELADQLEGLPAVETVLFDTGNLPFAEAFSTVVMLELDQRGIEFVVDDDAMARQLGSSRRFDGQASHRLSLLYGDEAEVGREGAERVAFVEGLDRDERGELDELVPDVRRLLLAGDLELTERGAKARRDGDLRDLEAEHDPEEVGVLLALREVGRAVLNGWVELDGDDGKALSRYARLQDRLDHHTVGVFLEPYET